MRRAVPFVLVLVLVFVAWSVADGQEASSDAAESLQKAMDLNRSGEWIAAADLADSLIESEGMTLRQRCEAFYSAAYARLRLGRLAEANTLAGRFDAECTEVSADDWLHGEMKKVREEAAQVPAVPADDSWLTGDAAEMGLDPALVGDHESLCEKTCADACVVVYKDRIVSEHYSDGYSPPVFAMSSTKSVTGVLVGMLIEGGKIESIDEPVSNYVPGWAGDRKDEVTIRHLLTHSSGLRRMWKEGVGSVDDKNAFVIGLEPAYPPGTRFDYSNEGVQLLSPLLDKAAGEPIQDYARRELFEPAGMLQTRLRVDGAGHAWTYADMSTTARDLVRLGQLMMNGGRVGDEQLVPEAWVTESTRPSALNPGYGLLWWLSHNPPGFAAMGYLNTNVYVFSPAGLIVVRTQSRPCATGEQVYRREAQELFRRLVADG